MKKRESVVYNIKIGNDFNYHIKKGILRKGSRITRKIHPIDVVNRKRHQLIQQYKVEKFSDYYILKENINIGLLLAVNLYYGKIIEEISLDTLSMNSSIDNREDIDSVGEGWNNWDSFASVSYHKDSLEFLDLHAMQIDLSLFRGNNPSKFSYIEDKVASVLQAADELSEFKHGDSEKNECDIIDEGNKVQIEILTEFKTYFEDKDRLAKEENIIIEMLNDSTVMSDALMKKFFRKNYSEDYEIQLAIFTLGYMQTIGNLCNQIDFIYSQPENIKNFFTKIHIIVYNPLENQIVYCNDFKKEKIFHINDFNLDLIKMNNVSVANLSKEKLCLLRVENIFSKEQMFIFLPGLKIIDFIKNMRIKLGSNL